MHTHEETAVLGTCGSPVQPPGMLLKTGASGEKQERVNHDYSGGDKTAKNAGLCKRPGRSG